MDGGGLLLYFFLNFNLFFNFNLLFKVGKFIL